MCKGRERFERSLLIILLLCHLSNRDENKNEHGLYGYIPDILESCVLNPQSVVQEGTCNSL